jgi:FAD:protein FMN transferase
MSLSSKILVVLLLFGFGISAQNLQKYTFTKPKMGSPFSIVLWTNDSLKAQNVAERAFSIVDSLNLIFSDYLPTSELSKLCQINEPRRWIPASKPLYDILQESKKAHRLSNGAFDVGIGTLVKLWRKARKEKILPADSLLKNTLQNAGITYIDLKKRKVRFSRKGIQLDLGGIAKGYSAQVVIDFLRHEGISYSLVDAGGDLVCGKYPSKNTQKGWRVAVNLPETDDLQEQFLSLQNMGVATSGGMYQYLEIGGVRYSHIVSPLTGLGLTHQRNVTAIAPTGSTADWLATACSVLEVNEAIKLADSLKGVAVLISVWDKNKVKNYSSKRWPLFVEPSVY